jgi:hypothetical protein
VNAACQLVGVKGLGHKIIRTGIHRFEVVGLPFESSSEVSRTM